MNDDELRLQIVYTERLISLLGAAETTPTIAEALGLYTANLRNLNAELARRDGDANKKATS